MNLPRRRLLRGEFQAPPAGPRLPWMVAPAACTGCGACAAACPQGIVAVEGRARLVFTAECSFCGACAEACPEPVFDRSGPAFRHAILIGGGCLPRLGVTCGSCADICPETAIRLRPRLGGPPLPVLDAAACSGCGACVAACPGEAIEIQPEEAAHG